MILLPVTLFGIVVGLAGWYFAIYEGEPSPFRRKPRSKSRGL